MLNVPQVDGSTVTSLTTMISLAVIIVGTLIAFVALPHVRSKISNHLKAPKEYFYGDTIASEQLKDGSATQDEEDSEVAPSARVRREIENFDLTIFEED